MNINITLNGKAKSVADGTTISSLLKNIDIDSARVAVEHNKEIVDRNQFESVHLKEGDSLEIITFVGGGNG